MSSRWRKLGALPLLLLASCGDGSAGSSQTAVPAAVEQMIAAAFPADGEIHVQKRGTFVIGKETVFCRHANGLMVDPEAANELFKRLGQPTTLGGGYPRVNGKIGADRECDLPNQVLVKGTQMPSRQNKPYKLVLAVWQGDVAQGHGAYWVGGVERLEGNYPVEGRAFHPGDNLEAFGEDNIAKTKEFDVQQLSQKFVGDIGKGAEK